MPHSGQQEKRAPADALEKLLPHTGMVCKHTQADQVRKVSASSWLGEGVTTVTSAAPGLANPDMRLRRSRWAVSRAASCWSSCTRSLPPDVKRHPVVPPQQRVTLPVSQHMCILLVSPRGERFFIRAETDGALFFLHARPVRHCQVRPDRGPDARAALQLRAAAPCQHRPANRRS